MQGTPDRRLAVSLIDEARTAGARRKPPCAVPGITWLPRPIRGQFTFRYRIIDLYSRKIVSWEVHEVENSAHARDLVEQTVWREDILDPPRRKTFTQRRHVEDQAQRQMAAGLENVTQNNYTSLNN